MLQGTSFGPPVPGAPIGGTGANYAIVGGTGAFLGARGYSGQMNSTPLVGGASISKDPGIRRNRPGDQWTYTMNVIPMYAPEIVTVWHSDFTPVTTARPARADEILIASVRGLGPTLPGVDPGTPFPATPVQTVSSPIEMTAGGQSVEVINQIGWPGHENLYRLDFRMPNSVASATAALHLTAAWINGSAFSIPVQ